MDVHRNRNAAPALTDLEHLTPTQLINWSHLARVQTSQGHILSRIPQLTQVQADWFAVHISCKSGQTHSLGDVGCLFPLMSVIKPFLLLYLLNQVGEDTVFQWVGSQPSEAPFNSLEQLVADQGRPRNPMINSGAIALADKLPGETATQRCQQLCQWLNQQAGCHLWLDEVMLASVRSSGRTTNQAIAQYLAQAGCLQDAGTALDTYEQLCCLTGQVRDLSHLGLLLTAQTPSISSHHRRIVNAVMLTCGLYEASSHAAVKIGLPMKSGVSGALLAIVPGQGAIACYSPALDPVGNSVAGLALIETLSLELGLSLFE